MTLNFTQFLFFILFLFFLMFVLSLMLFLFWGFGAFSASSFNFKMWGGFAFPVFWLLLLHVEEQESLKTIQQITINGHHNLSTTGF